MLDSLSPPHSPPLSIGQAIASYTETLLIAGDKDPGKNGAVLHATWVRQAVESTRASACLLQHLKKHSKPVDRDTLFKLVKAEIKSMRDKNMKEKDWLVSVLYDKVQKTIAMST
jgi:hypothetical protein